MRPSESQGETARDVAPARRVVLLGASNLAIHLPVVVPTAQALWGRPLELMAALGHGRSYGATSRVLGRELPGILHCGLWRDLEQRPPAETAALVTDIGNDLLYGAPVEQIVAWVETCLQRLADVASTLVVTELPLESTHRLTARRFQVLRSILFPRSRLTFEEALAQTSQLNARVQALAARHGALVVKPMLSWYGFDPIHIRRAQGPRAWQEILGGWSPEIETTLARASLAQRMTFARLRPLERRFWGRVQRQPQPASRLRDGTTIWLY